MGAGVERGEGRLAGVVARAGLWEWLRRGEWVRWFVRSAGVVLLVTGLAKLWSAMGEARALGLRDPLFGLRFRQLMAGVGLLEVMVSGVCLVGRRERFSLVLVGWLAGNFALYRVGLWWLDWKRPCGCSGHVRDTLEMPQQEAKGIGRACIGRLLGGDVRGVYKDERVVLMRAEGNASGRQPAL